jgi:hypothetical protein
MAREQGMGALEETRTIFIIELSITLHFSMSHRIMQAQHRGMLKSLISLFSVRDDAMHRDVTLSRVSSS